MIDYNTMIAVSSRLKSGIVWFRVSNPLAGEIPGYIIIHWQTGENMTFTSSFDDRDLRYAKDVVGWLVEGMLEKRDIELAKQSKDRVPE